jgi:hypothetical protein
MKTIQNLLITIIMMIVSVVVTYGLCSFVTLKLNPLEWSMNVRMGFSSISMFCIIVCGIVAIGASEE